MKQTTKKVKITVLLEAHDFGITYAEDSDSNRYVIDSHTKLKEPIFIGQTLIATVTKDGHVLETECE